MGKKLAVVLAIVVALSVVIATGAVSAKEPLRGDVTMTVNVDADGNPGLYGCPETTWFGAVVLDGTTYGMALYLTSSVFPGATQHWEEDWTIFSEEFIVEDGALANCEPGDAVLSGSEKGVIAFNNPSGKFHMTGTVEDASAPFAEWIGRSEYQEGVVGLVSIAGLENVLGYTGSIRFKLKIEALGHRLHSILA